MSTEAQLPQPGEIVDGKYRVESLLGKGGMGAVFVVRHVQTQRSFALKCMLASLIDDYEAEQRFIREAKLAGNVNHPGVVATYDIGRHRGSLYLVMELLSGESLSARIARGGFTVGAASHMMTTVLEAVAAAHDKGIVHRDLKPDNVFLNRAADGRGFEPKILDFGISKAISADGQPTLGLTKTGIMLGTPLYMAPEQVRGEKNMDQRTDIYALGVIFYEMLTGSVPFNGNSFADLVLKIVTGDTVVPSVHAPQVPPELDAIVMRALSVDQKARYADAMTFARAIAPFVVVPNYSSQRPPSALSAPPPARMPSAPPPPQALTPFASEARIDTLPVKSPWPMFAIAAAVVIAGAWLLLASGDADVEVTAEPNAPPTTLPSTPTAAGQSTDAPASMIPTGAIVGSSERDELPRGVSADVAPHIPEAELPRREREQARHAIAPAHEPRPAAHAEQPHDSMEEKLQPTWRPTSPATEQIIDPFEN